ncbi:sulfur carrier protein ThiS [Nocardia huaxiensis]|uniref:Sulfur carrier protein ThiS n=1 Tax=Nocardia huaxiensis TaxID=2755382 RepID=A0A7D6VJ33_9NOCA|nr:sulfur carrier protein ThiS [Nocardia huaxiensis]QLY30730.1 sulfur carrier protein ThiS [Nocardia huaxiensis]UFS94225.1 sulfur carrier protein ThiS [Nocardia huaxiensis]
MTIPTAITVNGAEHSFAEPPTLREVLEQLNLPCQGVAVAVDGALYPKSQWDEPVGRGWEIEVLTAVQGG